MNVFRAVSIALGALAATFCLGAAAQAQQNPTSGLFGNYYEAYTGPVQCTGGLSTVCVAPFPQNLTGQRIQLRTIQCYTQATSPLIRAQLIITDQTQSTIFKQVFLDTNASNTRVVLTQSVATVSGEFEVILAPNRIAVASFQTENLDGFVLQCSLSGQKVTLDSASPQ